jgi:hypothetical protein
MNGNEWKRIIDSYSCGREKNKIKRKRHFCVSSVPITSSTVLHRTPYPDQSIGNFPSKVRVLDGQAGGRVGE